ncbi:Indoleamine 2,3-dioxygenase [Flagelloscypha sp. PMI_526]|nr:Indoleamine 2,3-dioxygenase [Flagelloscypha sp. PMI_526]
MSDWQTTFSIDPLTGFVPSTQPLPRLGADWEQWEATLDKGSNGKIHLADETGLDNQERSYSKTWRIAVSAMPLLSVEKLTGVRSLRRAHLVLASITHLYVHSLPPEEPVIIPESLGIPFLKICNALSHPPTLTFSDSSLYNWAPIVDTDGFVPSIDNLRCQTLASGTSDEDHFHLVSTRIEMRGAEALQLIRLILDDIHEAKPSAITNHLETLASVIPELRKLLLTMKEGCNPDVFYNQIRPWLSGSNAARKWVFEGLDKHGLEEPTKLGGATAAQSALFHALDIFLGTDVETSANVQKMLEGMREYMPRPHREFLSYLKKTSLPLRTFVQNHAENVKLVEAYNATVMAMKEFRDAHFVIVTMYVISPARKAQKEKEVKSQGGTQGKEEEMKGTGGTDLAKFLKGVRDRTAQGVLETGKK